MTFSLYSFLSLAHLHAFGTFLLGLGGLGILLGRPKIPTLTLWALGTVVFLFCPDREDMLLLSASYYVEHHQEIPGELQKIYQLFLKKAERNLTPKK